MYWEPDFNCEYCKKLFRAQTWKSLDVVKQPQLRDVLMTEDFNLNTCPHCHNSFYIHGPLVLWEEHFVALSLAQRFYAEDAFDLIKMLLIETQPERKDLPVNVIVFSSIHKLRKALVDPDLTRMRIPIQEFSHRDWSFVGDPLDDAVDILIQNRLLEEALELYISVNDDLPEIFYLSGVRQRLEIIVYLLSKSKNTGQEHQSDILKRYYGTIGKIKPGTPTFEPFTVSYCPVDEITAKANDYLEGDMHDVTMRNPGIRVKSLSHTEKYIGSIWVLLALHLTEQWVQKRPEEFLLWKKIARLRIAFEADHIDTSDDWLKAQALAMWYEEITGEKIIP